MCCNVWMRKCDEWVVPALHWFFDEKNGKKYYRGRWQYWLKFTQNGAAICLEFSAKKLKIHPKILCSVCETKKIGNVFFSFEILKLKIFENLKMEFFNFFFNLVSFLESNGMCNSLKGKNLTKYYKKYVPFLSYT